jgi:DNA polymerase-3 subunit epsilon
MSSSQTSSISERAMPQRQWPARRAPRRLPDLPQFYYHTHFVDMLSKVAQRYKACLDAPAAQFIDEFHALPHAAQCAYVRIAGRKGHVFQTRKLSYPEIENLDAQFELLKERRFAANVCAQETAPYLNSLTKPELIEFLRAHLCASAFKSSWKKPLLIDAAMAHFDKDIITQHARDMGAAIVQSRRESLRYILYLYFGRIEDSLQPFTLRDLGLVKAPDFKDSYGPRFENKAEARTAYFYASALYDFRNGTDADVARLIDTTPDWPEPLCNVSQAGRDKLLSKLGGLSERLGDVATALTLYGLSETPQCNERTVRLRYSRNNDDDRDWVKTRLEAMIDNPASDDEYHFASDFYARKFDKKRTSRVTDILRGSEVLSLDEAFRHEPERAAARHYRAQGYTVERTENAPWKMLFGLLFWQELYASETSVLHNSFERLPANLKSGQFFTDNEVTIEAKLERLSNPAQTLLNILKVATRHHGTPNGIFMWRGRTLDRAKLLIETAPPAALAAMLRLMAKDWSHTKDGFPDLMLIKDGELSFFEIKAEGDVIRRNQLTRIAQLKAAGFETSIARIDWVIDPNQIYVVVDVETTGGRAGNHRLTEIGAIKMQGGEIIDEWQSLLNPQRPIPPNITRLTGITNEMVSGAPLFQEVADSFAAFMGDAIFAAHNVNFDYGFISMEYRRIERRFRHPKICTVASMRKLYPGHKSYSLKNLCADYDIDLTTHHRALCDARAAAELLKLVNIKRLEDVAD